MAFLKFYLKKKRIHTSVLIEYMLEILNEIKILSYRQMQRKLNSHTHKKHQSALYAKKIIPDGIQKRTEQMVNVLVNRKNYFNLIFLKDSCIKQKKKIVFHYENYCICKQKVKDNKSIKDEGGKCYLLLKVLTF